MAWVNAKVPAYEVEEVFSRVLEHFPLRDVQRTLEALVTWFYGIYPGSSWKPDRDHAARVASRLIKGQEILAFCSPIPPLPATLYRGMTDLPHRPTTGQRVAITLARPITSWSEKRPEAKRFCEEDDDGILLEVSSRKLLANADLIVWPWTARFKKAVKALTAGGNFAASYGITLREWAFWLRKETIVDRWTLCSWH